MGFDAGIYVTPKYNNVTYDDIKTISNLLDYESNKWAQGKYSSAEEYAKDNMGDKYKPQSEDAINFYREHLITDDFGYKHTWKDYCYWCSNGAGEIYDFIKELGEPYGDGREGTIRILSKKDIADFMQFCLDTILEYAPQPCEIVHAYKYQRNEDGDIPDDTEITLTKVDGFEVRYETEDGGTLIQRIDTNPDWDCCLGFPKKYIDEWTYNGYIIGLEACAKILGEVDFDNSFVVYNGGW